MGVNDARALAGRLDFGDLPAGKTIVRGTRSALRLAPSPGRLHGPDKYKELDVRRRRAQIRARRALDLM
jgi:hypothetical protein